jgi:hypothetical protein
MIVPKKARIEIYKNFFKEGVMVAAKDRFSKHIELTDIDNL